MGSFRLSGCSSQLVYRKAGVIRLKTILSIPVGVILLAAVGYSAANEPSSDQSTGATPQSPPTWLEAVQAQRLARMEAVRKKHEATRAKISEHAKAMREAARARAGTLPPPPPGFERDHDNSRQDQTAGSAAGAENPAQRPHEEARYPGYWVPPYGWANPWYYRGY